MHQYRTPVRMLLKCISRSIKSVCRIGVLIRHVCLAVHYALRACQEARRRAAFVPTQLTPLYCREIT